MTVAVTAVIALMAALAVASLYLFLTEAGAAPPSPYRNIQGLISSGLFGRTLTASGNSGLTKTTPGKPRVGGTPTRITLKPSRYRSRGDRSCQVSRTKQTSAGTGAISRCLSHGKANAFFWW